MRPLLFFVIVNIMKIVPGTSYKFVEQNLKTENVKLERD